MWTSLNKNWSKPVVLSLALFVSACNGSSGQSTDVPAVLDSEPVPIASLQSSDISADSDSEPVPRVSLQSSDTPAFSDSEPVPSVSLQSSALLVSAGDFLTLTWSSGNADACSASGGWSGSLELSGSLIVGPLQQDTSFILSCSGPGGGGVKQLTVEIDSGDGVTVNLTANPQQLAVSGSSTLSWNSSNATECQAAGGWSGSQPLTGSFVASGLTATSNYQLTCSGPSGSAVSMVEVEVLDGVLRWQAPTQNVDGSPLDDLAGYQVYWGTQSRAYTDSVTITSPTTTQWQATTAAGAYYFALTAFDTGGNESAYSNEVLKTIP
jgi:hypothetical protein